MDVSGLLESLERAGGYAALTGLIVIIVFFLARTIIADQAKRAVEREKEMAQRAVERELEREQRHQRELEREAFNASVHREDKQILVQVVQENSRSNTALVGAVEKLADVQARTNDRLVAIDKHLVTQKGGAPRG